jgi:hypothetical protein
MPQQSIYLDEQTKSTWVQVLKVYDSVYARSCFDEMDEPALAFLSASLRLANKYDRVEPAIQVAWEDVEEDAREDGNLFSFFVVTEKRNGNEKPVYVSPDWPSAEIFAKSRLANSPAKAL